MRNFNARRLHRFVIDDPFQINFFEKDVSDEDLSGYDWSVDLDRGECVTITKNPANDITSLTYRDTFYPPFRRPPIP